MSESATDSILSAMLLHEKGILIPSGEEKSKTDSGRPSTRGKTRGRKSRSSLSSEKRKKETKPSGIVLPENFSVITTEKEEEQPQEQEPIFEPNAGPQTDFLAAPEQEILYGGAAGGGKSYALLADAVRYAIYPDYVGLILRRTNDELRELVQKAQLLYPQAFPGAKWRKQQSEWQFPSGARLWFAYLDNDDDVMRYQGQAFSYIGFDELTQYPTPTAWDYLRSRLRNTNPNIPLQQRGTTNPGGPGHCLREGEVYTPDGWVDIKDMKVGDPVYTVSSAGKLVESRVNNIVKEYVKEPLITIKGRGLHVEGTREHRVALSGYRDTFAKLTKLKDLPGQCTILRSFDYDGEHEDEITIEHSGGRKRKLSQPHTIKSEDYYSLVGWYLSEGCRIHRDKAINIAQSKPHTRSIIEDLLDRIGYKYSTSPTGYTIYCPSLYYHMEKYGDLCVNKRLTKEAKKASNSNMGALLDALMLGDGCEGVYYTSSEQLCDDVGDIALKLGYIVHFSERQRKNRSVRSYAVSTKKTKSRGTEVLTGNHVYDVATSTKRKSDVSEAYYEGFVYCIGVPDTHNFVVRQKGSVWVSGNSWVKKMFIDPAPSNTPFWARNIETGEVLRFPKFERDGVTPHKYANKPLFQRKFIPAMLQDNPYLTNDPNYEANLLSLPEIERKRLLDGNWDVVSGAAFPEFNRNLHVVSPFDIPSGWTRFRACDYGYGSHTSVLWFAVHPSGQLIVYRELYVTGVTAPDLADKIIELEQYYGDRVSYGILDSSMWHKRGDPGPSLAEKMINRGCKWRPSDRSKGSRVSGKNELHSLLQVDEYLGQPRILFFNTCTDVISHLPMLPLDKKNPEDVDTNFVHDHSYDALRYGIMSRPRSRTTMDFLGAGSSWRDNYRPVDPKFGA